MASEKLSASVEIPEGVEVSVEGKRVKIKGPKGEVSREIIHPRLQIEKKENQVNLIASKSTKREKKLVHTYRSHVRNMIKGSQQGHAYKLKVCSSHFPMNVAVNNNQVIVKNFLGEKFPRTLDIKEGVDVKVDADVITVESVDKEKAGMTASAIEELMKRPGFDRRIFQDGIYITHKDGKEL